MNNKIGRGGSGKNQPTNSGRPIVKKEKVPVKIDPSKELDVELVTGKGVLKDALTVYVTDGKISRQFTYHHPIGVTPELEGGDWVCTPTSEIPTLLSHQVDPDVERIRSSRAKLRNDLAVTLNVLKRSVDGTSYVYPKTGGNRDELIKEARSHADLQLEADMKAWLANRKPQDSNEAGKPKRKNPLEFLDSKYQEEEREVQKAFDLPDTQKEMDKKFPFTFRTRSGQLLDRDQVRVNEKGKTLTSTQVLDSLVYKVSNTNLKTIEEIRKVKEEAVKTPT